MELQEQIKIVKELIDATKELNGEFQDGWDENIEDGERLLDYLKSEVKKLNIPDVIGSLPCEHMYSRTMNQPYPRKCVWCGEVEKANLL